MSDPEPSALIPTVAKATASLANGDDDDDPWDGPGYGTGIDWNEFHTTVRYPDATD